MSPKAPREQNGESASRVRVNIMIDPDLLEQLRSEAAEEDRSFSSQLNRNLRLWYELADEEEEE